VTVKEALIRARQVLSNNNIEDASLESELLLRHILRVGRVQLYLGLDQELSPDQQEALWQVVRRRLEHEPTAYITRHREFYGLDFYVDSDVLIPRPETEILLEKAIDLARNNTIRTIADIGTGSGAIAISLAVHLSHAEIYATDISAAALRIARLNCQKHGVTDRVHLLEGNMLEPLPESVDLIVANLPYVKESDMSRVNTVKHEPSLALDGGSDGVAKIRLLCAQVKSKLHPRGNLLLEMGQGQAEAVHAILYNLFPSAKIEVTPDLSGIERVVSLALLQ
jgi:release factor glutamine methyltransferase